MKQLQESLLDDEDILLNDTHNSAIIHYIFNTNEKADKSRYVNSKKCLDAYGNELKLGDFVIGDYVGNLHIGYIIALNEKSKYCTLAFTEHDVEWYNNNKNQDPRVPSWQLIKIKDPKIIMKLI